MIIHKIEVTKAPATIRYNNDVATVTVADLNIYIEITSKELRKMYNWGRGGKVGQCLVSILKKAQPVEKK